MSDATHEWSERVRGVHCRFDQPRDLPEEFHFVAALSSSTLYLDRNQLYRGYCVLIYDRRHVTRIDQLDVSEWMELSRDLHRSHVAIWKAFAPSHMNVVSLGNLIPHLHWHLIPRYLDDPRWGSPIWPTAGTPRVILEDVEYTRLADRIRALL